MIRDLGDDDPVTESGSVTTDTPVETTPTMLEHSDGQPGSFKIH